MGFERNKLCLSDLLSGKRCGRNILSSTIHNKPAEQKTCTPCQRSSPKMEARQLSSHCVSSSSGTGPSNSSDAMLPKGQSHSAKSDSRDSLICSRAEALNDFHPGRRSSSAFVEDKESADKTLGGYFGSKASAEDSPGKATDSVFKADVDAVGGSGSDSSVCKTELCVLNSSDGQCILDKSGKNAKEKYEKIKCVEPPVDSIIQTDLSLDCDEDELFGQDVSGIKTPGITRKCDSGANSSIADVCKPPEFYYDTENEVIIDVTSKTRIGKTKSALPSSQKRRDSSRLSDVHSSMISLSAQSNSQYVNCTFGETSKKMASDPCYGFYALTHNDHDYCFHSLRQSSVNESFISDDSLYCRDLPDVTPIPAWGLGCNPATASYRLQPYHEYNSLDSLQLNDSMFFSVNLKAKEEFVAIRNIGLTRIDLERLAETNSIGESLSVLKNSKAEEDRNERVRERREQFLYAMQSNKKKFHKEKHHKGTKCAKCVKTDNPLLRKWLRVDALHVDEISQLLEDVTDILYNKRPVMQGQHLNSCTSNTLIRSHRGRRMLFQEFNEALHVSKFTGNQCHGNLLAKSLSSIGSSPAPLHGDVSIDTNPNANPEISHSVTDKNSSETATSSNSLAKTGKAYEKCVSSSLNSNYLRQLRSRAIKLKVVAEKEPNSKTKKKPDQERTGASTPACAAKDKKLLAEVEGDSSTHSGGCSISKSEGVLSEMKEALAISQEWTALTEEWMREPMDSVCMLRLVE